MQALWTERAQRDLNEILVYVMGQSEKNALLVLARIERTVGLLCLAPDSGRLLTGRSERERAIPRTPYLLVYRVRDGKLELLSLRRGARKA